MRTVAGDQVGFGVLVFDLLQTGREEILEAWNELRGRRKGPSGLSLLRAREAVHDFQTAVDLGGPPPALADRREELERDWVRYQESGRTSKLMVRAVQDHVRATKGEIISDANARKALREYFDVNRGSS